MRKPTDIKLPSELTVITFEKTIELLSLSQHVKLMRLTPDFDAAIKVALFVLRLLERGDLTYEPLP